MGISNDIIRTEIYYKRIIEEQLSMYVKPLLLTILFFIVAYFAMDQLNDFIMPIIVLVLFTLLCIIDYTSKRKRVLLSASISDHLLIIEYLYLFRIHKTEVLIKDLSIRNYYKRYGKTALLTLEFKTKEKLLIEIREDEEYGWDNALKGKLIKRLCPPVPYEDRSHMGKKIKFLGSYINVQK